MEKKTIVRGRALTKAELDANYGSRRVEVGKCFARDNHLYRQYPNFVLHINKGEAGVLDYLVNKLHEGFFNDTFFDFEEIEPFEFENELSNIILDLKEIAKI